MAGARDGGVNPPYANMRKIRQGIIDQKNEVIKNKMERQFPYKEVEIFDSDYEYTPYPITTHDQINKYRELMSRPLAYQKKYNVKAGTDRNVICALYRKKLFLISKLDDIERSQAALQPLFVLTPHCNQHIPLMFQFGPNFWNKGEAMLRYFSLEWSMLIFNELLKILISTSVQLEEMKSKIRKEDNEAMETTLRDIFNTQTKFYMSRNWKPKVDYLPSRLSRKFQIKVNDECNPRNRENIQHAQDTGSQPPPGNNNHNPPGKSRTIPHALPQRETRNNPRQMKRRIDNNTSGQVEEHNKRTRTNPPAHGTTFLQPVQNNRRQLDPPSPPRQR